MGESVLEKEIDTFMEQLPSMLGFYEGEYVIFSGNDNLGFWHSYDDALKVAYEKLGLTPFLLRKVSLEYEVFGKYGKPFNFFNI